MKIRHLLLLSSLGLAWAVGACTSAGGQGEGIEIRVANRSDRDFSQVTVTFPSDKVEYGPVARGAASEYRPVKKAYRYARLDVVAGGKTFDLQPIDYVGESLLQPGRYTYAVSIDASDGSETLVLDLLED